MLSIQRVPIVFTLTIGWKEVIFIFRTKYKRTKVTSFLTGSCNLQSRRGLASYSVCTACFCTVWELKMVLHFQLYEVQIPMFINQKNLATLIHFYMLSMTAFILPTVDLGSCDRKCGPQSPKISGSKGKVCRPQSRVALTLKYASTFLKKRMALSDYPRGSLF